ncbi:hypothetical protein LP421_33610 (plasmid) [Rhizobium sp. RCAM05350]|nr:hypothetical protein LP421_33610 [Rhizobium sp. RCAM05350]
MVDDGDGFHRGRAHGCGNPLRRSRAALGGQPQQGICPVLLRRSEYPENISRRRQALSDPLVNFVYISAVRERRKHYIATAAKAGKHILCDGPIAGNSRVAGTLVEQCKQAGVALVVNQPSRASTIHQTMRRLLAEGEIGTLQSLQIIRGAPFQPSPNRRANEVTARRHSSRHNRRGHRSCPVSDRPGTA